MYHLEPPRRTLSFGPPQWLVVIMPVVVGFAVGLVPLVAGWPYWTGHPLSAALAMLMPATLAGAGALLVQGAESGRTGWLFIASALLYAGAWSGARNTGWFPLIGEFTQSVFFLTLGIGILLHGRARFDRWFEWAWTAEAFVILLGVQTAMFYTVGPDRLGYAGDVVWPATDVAPSVGTAMTKAGGIAYVVLALSFVAVLIAQRRRRSGPRNGVALVVVSGLFAVAASIIQYPIMAADSSLAATMAARSAQGTSAIILPLTLFASALRTTWTENTLAARLVRKIGHATHDSVQLALREVLADPALEVWYWIPSASAFVDDAGRVRHPPSADTTLEIRSPAGPLLAVCLVGTSAPRRPAALRPALDVCAAALQAVQLQHVHAEHVRDVQERLMAAEDEGRKELARDLHDGVQQDLAAIRIEISSLMRQLPADGTREKLAWCAERVVSVIEQVRGISRGLHPTSLAHGGLAGALEEVAEGVGRRIQLDVPDERFAPRVELAMYYILNEALTNVVKHARAGSVSVRVELRDAEVVGEVADDGVGGAAVTLGGGLHGVQDRIRALRGRLQLDSPAGHGTRLTVTLPLIGARS